MCIYLVGNFSSFTSLRTLSPVPLSSSFQPMSETLNTNVSQVSNIPCTLYTTWFHFISPFPNLEQQTPVQAPGLGSFIANFVVGQLDVRHRFVDFQCFGKGLWTKAMSNHVKLEKPSAVATAVFYSKSIFVTVLLNFNASARAFGQKWGQTQ